MTSVPSVMICKRRPAVNDPGRQCVSDRCVDGVPSATRSWVRLPASPGCLVTRDARAQPIYDALWIAVGVIS